MIGVTSISYKTCGYMIPVDNSDSQNIILTFEMPFGSRIMCGNCTIENETSLISDGKLTKTENGYFIEKAIPNLKITRSKSNVSPLTILRGRELLYCDNTNKVINLSTPYQFRRALVFNGQIHTLMGETATTHYKYDGVNWIEASTLPYTATNSSVIAYKGELHLIGGHSSGTISNHYKWDGKNWVSVTKLTNGQSNITVFEHNNEMHMIGLFDSTGTAPKTCMHHKFNDSTNTWEQISTVPFYISSGDARSVKGKIHAFGNGVNHYIWDGTTWTQSTDLPVNYDQTNGCAVVYNNELHILGGTSSTTKHYKWDEATSTWVDVSTLPYAITRAACCVFDDKIHLISAQTEANKNKYYEWDGTTWKNSKRVSIWNVPMGTRINKALCTTTGENMIKEKANYLIEL